MRGIRSIGSTITAAACLACGSTQKAISEGDEPSVPCPTPAEAEAAAARAAAPGSPPRWAPGTLHSFQILHFESAAQLEQRLSPVDVVNLELDQVEAAGGATLTDSLRARGTRVVCYLSTGYEEWRSDAASFPAAARGGPICQNEDCSESWPGEAWGDIRSPALHTYLDSRFARARSAGCDGVEFDNMDQAFNRTGFEISVQENIDAARALASLAHARGLAAMAKNAAELSCALAPSFDGVFIEECQGEDECDAYLPYRGKLVAMVEYEARCQTRDWAACREQGDYFEE